MLLALQSAITAALQSALPSLFSGAGAVAVAFAEDDWSFDALSADPVAGQPGPEDAVDRLAFDPAAPAGPYTLTRAPYPGPKRVYLRSAAGELVALLPAELAWNPADAATFTVLPRAGRDLSGFNQLEVQYGVVAAGTRLKIAHQFTIGLQAVDAAKLDQALALGLAVLALNRDALREQGGWSYNAGSYQAQGTLKTLAFASGSSMPGSGHRLVVTAELDLRVQRLLSEGEGQPITHILSPGKVAGSRAVDVDPAVQS